MALLELLSYPFFLRALMGAIATAVVCGIIGTYVVSRRMVFLSGGITHASFGGIGLALFLGFNPILGAMLAASTSALGVNLWSRNGRSSEDSLVAMLWALGMALGVIFTSLTPGYTTSFSNYLFGNILLVGYLDIALLLSYLLLLTALLLRCYQPIVYSAFDADFYQIRGGKPFLWNTLMLLFVSLGLVLSIRLVGIMLLMSLITLPQMIASLYRSSFLGIMFLSIFISVFSAILGLVLSVWVNISPSGLIVFLLFVFYLIARLHQWLKAKSLR